MKNLMIDLETLATTPGAAIISLAAVFFDFEKGTIHSGKQWLIDPRSDVQPGEVALEGLQWAEEHGTWPVDAEQAATTVGALTELRQMLLDHTPEREWALWSWGADFDFPILESAFRRCGMRVPWKYSQVRDARTVWKLAFPGVIPDPRPHDAMRDCLAQIQDLKAAMRELSGKGEA